MTLDFLVSEHVLVLLEKMCVSTEYTCGILFEKTCVSSEYTCAILLENMCSNAYMFELVTLLFTYIAYTCFH